MMRIPGRNLGNLLKVGQQPWAKRSSGFHLIENEKWNSAVNRLYYASFYAVTGLLVNSEITTKSHSGVKTQFFLNFIKAGIIDQELGKLYGDFFDFEEKDVNPLSGPTPKLIDRIKDEIEN